MPARNDDNPYGWDANRLKRINNIQLPVKIKCNKCKKHMMGAKYSSKQLMDYRMNIDRSGMKTASTPKCRGCTGQQVTEMTCSQCDITKGLASFSLAQRRNPDHAKCLDCQQEIEDQVPDVADALEELEIRQEIESGRGSAFSTTASLSGYSNAGSRNASSVNGYNRQQDDNGDGVWVPLHCCNSLDFSARQSQENGLYSNRSGPTSPPSSAISDATTVSLASTGWADFKPEHQPYREKLGARSNSGTSGTAQNTNPGFANVKADWRNKSAHERAMDQQAREEKKVVEANQALNDSDDDEGSDWEL